MNIFRIGADSIHLLGMITIVYDIIHKRNCTGISGITQILYAQVFMSRYTDLLLYYVSIYNTFMKITYILMTFIAIILIFVVFRKSYDRKNDSIFHLLWTFPAALLAFKYNSISISDVRSYDDLSYYTEILWSSSIYLEVVAIVPQYVMFRKTKNARCLYYVAMLCTYRSLYIANWIVRYFEENRYSSIATVSGVIQAIILIIVIIDIELNKEKPNPGKWREIQDVFTVEAAKLAQPTKVKIQYPNNEQFGGQENQGLIY
ncbi:unnamed protein product [Ceutorhynchus assimilis]|uniref:ER lumen protein-retaining receptor n=1 Tax=Ceutorhynchus assimilis TaxID=467358 RepID=A0A9N9MK87_9CUCU|nr:unnamed protein product [Ceutorhynchus assimilis]